MQPLPKAVHHGGCCGKHNCHGEIWSLEDLRILRTEIRHATTSDCCNLPESACMFGGVAQLLERRSLAGELSLS